jgi:MerR family copper efflux transcriptional regulator
MTTETPSPASEDTSAMHIGEVAARTELSLRTLRHYDEIGLLQPSGRTHGGFRLYTEADVDKIMLIRRMKPLGFTLDQMSAVLRDIVVLHENPGDDQGGARERLSTILSDATERRAKLEQQLAMADEFISLLNSGGLGPR